MNERNYDGIVKTIRSYADGQNICFGRSSAQYEMRTSLLMRLRERGEQQFEWLGDKMYTNNVADIFQYEYLVKEQGYRPNKRDIVLHASKEY